MKSVFLVDDEPLITDTIEALINWEKYNMKICGTANDGWTAREMILEKCPDFVITDIRMPGLNGLELISSVQNSLPDTVFAIISGYNDFSYIRTALRLNVVDYLDKPVTIEKIESMLVEVQGILEKRRIRKENEKIWENRNTQQVLEKYINAPDAFLREVPKELEIMDRIHVLSLKCNSIFNYKECLKILQMEMDLLKIRLALVETSEGCTIVGWAGQPYSMNEVYAIYEKKFMPWLSSGLVTAVGMSRYYEYASNIKTAVIEAKCAKDYAVFFEEGIVRIEAVEIKNKSFENLVYDTQMAVFLRTGQWDKAEEILKEIFRQMDELHPEPDVIKHICLEIIYMNLSVCAESGQEYSDNGQPFLPHVRIASINNGGELKEWTWRTFYQLIGWMQERRTHTGHKDILKAKRYIDEHFNEPITLQFLAEMCFMNPNYFSAIFRDNVGMTYVKYLNTVRMEHAKQMIRSGLKIKQVSLRCGYQNTRYFSERFKAYTGVTPEQYRTS